MQEKYKFQLKSLKKHIRSAWLLIFLFVVMTANTFGQSITWQRIINNNYSNYNKVIQTHDNYYVAVGFDKINTIDYLVISKFDIYGNEIWHKFIGNGNSEGNWVEETNDNNYIICGRFFDGNDSKFYLVKADTSGTVIWEKSYNNSDNDQARCVKETSDNGYIIIGTTFPSNVGIYFVKTDSLGMMLNQKVFMNNYNQFMYEIIEVNSFFWGIGSISKNNADLLLYKFNSDLDTVWTKTFGGNNLDVGNSLDRIDYNSIVLGGVSKSFNQNNRVESYILTIDTNANLIWQRTYSYSYGEICSSIRFKQGIGIIDAGNMDSINNISQAKLRLLDLDGNILKEKYFIPETYGAGFESAELTNDNGVIAAGYVTYVGAFEKMYIVKTDSLLFAEPIGLVNISAEIPKSFALYQNYPNPFNPETNIKFQICESTDVKLIIFNTLGKEIDFYDFSNIKPGVYSLKWYANNLASGIYFYKLITDHFTQTNKMVLLK